MKETSYNNRISFFEYTDADFGGFLDCINNFYQGGYPYVEYLNRENLHRLISSDELIITVAKNQDGRVVGTSAARKMTGIFEGSVLLLLHCVLDSYQNMGIGTNQLAFLLELVSHKFPDAISLFANAMTHNNISQRSLLKYGFSICGLRMFLYRSELMVPKLSYPDGTRMSQAIYGKSAINRTVSIYAPLKHRPIIRDIYASLGVPCIFETDTDSLKTDDVYHIDRNDLHQEAELFLLKYGSGTHDELFSDISSLISQGYMITAYINMTSPECPHLYDMLSDTGFYFTGISPLSLTGDYLLMSYTHGRTYDTDIIALTNPGYSLLEYIIRNRTF